MKKNWFNNALLVCGAIFIAEVCFFIVLVSTAIINPEGIPKVIAQSMIKEDALVKSDAIVVIRGFENEKRANYGIELYKQGYGKKIIVSGAGNKYYLTDYMTSRGVKKEDILLELTSETIYENADNVKKIAAENSINSFILVTTPDQSKGARMVFDNVFSQTGIRILSSSNRDSEFKPGKIMKSKNAKQQLVIEGANLIYYTFRYKE